MVFRNKFPNFYIRNIFLLILFITLALTNVYVKYDTPSWWQILSSIIFYCYIYFWMLFHNKVMLDFLYFKKKYLLYVLSLAAGFGIFIVVSSVLVRYSFDNIYAVLKGLSSYVVNTIFAATLYISFKYFRDKQSLLKLSLLKKEIELNQLKSQLYPHFLFNALNNIYSYTLNDNRYGNELILKLSELMRFILDSEKKEIISLESELRFIENYLTFERERLGERCRLNYSRSVKYYSRNIAPLLLFPFIENAFKHGANTIQKTSIDILFTDSQNSFRMIISNNIINANMPSTKIGLNNSMRRLELLYPEKYKIDIKSDNGLFKVDLTLIYDKD